MQIDNIYKVFSIEEQEEIKFLYYNYRNNWKKKISAELYEKIKDISISFAYHIITNGHPTCENCGKVMNKIGRFCSTKCSANSKNTQNKRKTSNKEIYGHNSPLSNKEVQEKYKNTCQERYGVDNPAKSDIIKNKTKEVNILKYGCSAPLSNKEVQEKYKNTCQERYGVDNVSMNQIIKKKISEGVKLSYNQELIDKKRKLQRKKYFNTFLIKLIQKNIIYEGMLNEYLCADKIELKCKVCNNKFTTSTFNPQKIYCPLCSSGPKSSIEASIFEWLSNYVDNLERGNRSQIGLELDIYNDKHKIAIEYNGNYWHSEIHKDKLYHFNKTSLCENKNIRLIHVSENDWFNNNDKIKSIILAAFGIYSKRIYARKCIVRDITSAEYKLFLENNHLQGPINSKIKLGLIYNNDIIAVMGLGQSRFKSTEFELHRFCVKLNYSVVGGFSKLLNKVKTHQTIVSFIDRSHFDGKSYKKSGFEIDNILKPSYVYWKSNEYISRYEAQKHKLEKILKNFDNTKTEHENMLNNGYLRIYDSGTLKVVLNKI